jgi:hypothetical protein
MRLVYRGPIRSKHIPTGNEMAVNTELPIVNSRVSCSVCALHGRTGSISTLFERARARRGADGEDDHSEDDSGRGSLTEEEAACVVAASSVPRSLSAVGGTEEEEDDEENNDADVGKGPG